MPESRKIGVSATWMTCATKSSDESGLSRPGISLPLERNTTGKRGIEVERVFWPPLEIGEIDMHKPEPLVISELPFETVEQGPHKIATHRNPGRDCVKHRSQIPAQIGYPLLVAEASV